MESMSKLLLMWAGGGLSLVLGEAGTSRHLGSTENIRMLVSRTRRLLPELLQKSRILELLQVLCGLPTAPLFRIITGSMKFRVARVNR